MKSKLLEPAAPTTHRRRRAAQLDFALPAPPPAPRRERPVRPCSRARAQWWFDQMRRLIDEGRSVDAPGVF